MNYNIGSILGVLLDLVGHQEFEIEGNEACEHRWGQEASIFSRCCLTCAQMKLVVAMPL